ncbi:MAG TPA: 3'-5' exonuclease [Edaphocola sp.]|nr:3'-5' exonuclease [Edaphocola sp.]
MKSLSSSYASIFHKTLVLDIETVPCEGNWQRLDEAFQKHWRAKAEHLSLSEEEMEHPGMGFESRAGIYAEFGKVVCIGLGLLTKDDRGNDLKIRLKSLFNHDEKALLAEFSQTIRAFVRINGEIIFCGHNIREFDIPFLCRRFLINGLPLPDSMQFGGLKPWQVPMEDTLHLWRFGDYKHYTSLDLLATVLNVPSSKTDLDGSQVAEVYWKEKNLEKIADYCLRDIYTTALVYLKLKGWQGALPTAEKA